MEPTRILVPCDFSLTSSAALSHAIKLAQKEPSELHLLHITPESSSALTRARGERGNEDRRQRATVALEQLISPQHELKVAPSISVREGKPVREILAYARDHKIQLIVLGTHGRSGFAHIALGSVAEKIVRNSLCPVLVVPRDSRDEAYLVRHAAEIIVREFGETLYGERSQTSSQLRERIERLLEVDAPSSETILHKLEEQGIITWTPSEDTSQTPRKGEWRLGSSLTSSIWQTAPTTGESAPAIDLLQRAMAARASDIHIDPWSQDEYLIRFRVDGSLESYCRVDMDIAGRLIHQFKMLGNLDIADPFHPREGRLRIPPSLGNNEVRITTSPAVGGEAVALRLFALESVFRELGELGLTIQSLADVENMLRQGEGIVLVTGPTGSGKTTSVYSMLGQLGDGSRNIVSIEDPVEYPVPFVRQMSVDERHGITMTSGLRTLLRMDPDVVFVGEIRDVEAAEIGMRAASSGKYVFSTLHTRDVASTITAVRDLHIDNRSLAGNLTGIINQRLVRKLCPHCRIQTEIFENERQAFRLNEMDPPSALFRSEGCEKCRQRGFLGRAGIFEVAIADEALCDAIARGVAENELRQLLRAKGTVSLTRDGLRKVAEGVTCLNDALEMSWI